VHAYWVAVPRRLHPLRPNKVLETTGAEELGGASSSHDGEVGLVADQVRDLQLPERDGLRDVPRAGGGVGRVVAVAVAHG
jgi:hypothetical protein